MKKNLRFPVMLFMAIGILFFAWRIIVKNDNPKVLSVENIEMTINTSCEINFSVVNNDGDDITSEYKQDETVYQVEDDSVVVIENNKLIALSEGETRIKMKLFHNEGPIKGKKGVVIGTLETKFDVKVVK